MRLITRRGYDWTQLSVNRGSSTEESPEALVIDSEAVILGVDGVSDFDALHSGKHNEEVQLYAFDVLAMGGEDLRSLPLSMRKANLERLPARRHGRNIRAGRDWAGPTGDLERSFRSEQRRDRH